MVQAGESMAYRLDYESLTVFVVPVEYVCNNCHFRTRDQALEQKHFGTTRHTIRSMPLRDSEEEYDPLKHGDLPDNTRKKLDSLKEKPSIIPILQEALEREYSKDRDGVHVSDLVLCPRKAVFRKVDPVPLTMRDLNFFSSGRAIHEAIQQLVKENPERYEIEYEVSNMGLVEGHVDIYDKELNIPIEAKSIRVKDIKEPKPHHVKQLKAYMAMLDAEQGIILYQCLMHFDDKPFVEFVVNCGLEERRQILSDMQGDAEKVASGKPELARHIALDANVNWLCRDCPYKAQCEEMRKAEEKA